MAKIRGKVKIIDILSVLIIITTYISVDQWSEISLGPPVVQWPIFFLSFYCIFRIYKFKYRNDPNQKGASRSILMIYLLWVTVSALRGLIFQAEFYWDYKELIQNTACLLLPSLIFVIYFPSYAQAIIYRWMRYALPLFLIFFFLIDAAAYCRYLSIILLMGCFIPAMIRKWKVFFICLLIFLFFADFTARSQMIEAMMCFVISFSYPFVKRCSHMFLKLVHNSIYLLPFILFSLAVSGVFNIFNMEEYLSDIQVQNTSGDDESLIADSRTMIYQEVLLSAINNNYVLFGRTPARGYDSMQFGGGDSKVYDTTKRFERYESEVLHPNVFTWLGLIGVILYSLIYLKSSYNAVLRSNNSYVKLLGLYVAFRWMYGWVEDYNRWDIMNISLWMMISICYSPYFRRMTNEEMKQWVRGCLPYYK